MKTVKKILRQVYYHGVKAEKLDISGVDNIQQVHTTSGIESALSDLRELLPKEELHTHDSIPCYTGEENSGCSLCIRNKTIAEVMELFK